VDAAEREKSMQFGGPGPENIVKRVVFRLWAPQSIVKRVVFSTQGSENIVKRVVF